MLNRSLILCLFVAVISLASATHLSDPFLSDVVDTELCQLETFDVVEDYDVFDLLFSGELALAGPNSFSLPTSAAGDKTNGFPLFYSIRAPPA
ncbi:MAG: hypothetical protein QNK31_09835 [Porticoccus sp.]|nr:hypothetical protein [Porticoccus sp.]